jgi:hypothetical protein
MESQWAVASLAASVVHFDILDYHGGRLTQKGREVLPRYGLRSTYITIFGGFCAIGAVLKDFLKNGGNSGAPQCASDLGF